MRLLVGMPLRLLRNVLVVQVSLKLNSPDRNTSVYFVYDIMEEIDYTWVIIGTIVGFFALAALLLVPVYRFLNREEKASEAWTKDTLHRERMQNRPNNEV